MFQLNYFLKLDKFFFRARRTLSTVCNVLQLYRCCAPIFPPSDTENKSLSLFAPELPCRDARYNLPVHVTNNMLRVSFLLTYGSLRLLSLFTLGLRCVDKSSNCPSYSLSQCEHSGWILRNCRKTCKAKCDAGPLRPEGLYGN